MTDPVECQKRIARGGWAEDLALNNCAFPVGPRNTWSNLAYPLAGVGLVLLDPSPWSRAFAICLLALGLGSGVYHGVKTKWSNSMDWAGMYIVFAALTLHGLVPQAPMAAWLVVPLAGAVAWQFGYRLKGIALNAHMGLFLGISLIPPLSRGAWPLAVAGFGTFLLAYGIWQLDNRKSRWTRLWGHAVWHVLTAVAIGMLTVLLAVEPTNRPFAVSAGDFMDKAFEVVSALGTVGLSTGITPFLNPGGKVVILLLMFIGRLGPITAFIALSRGQRKQAIEYAQEEPLIG